MGVITRLIVVALSLWLASELVPGIEVRGSWTLVGAAILLGLVNAVVRPVLVILTLPVTILTLGLFLLVINAAMLGLVAAMFDGFTIESFGSAMLASFIISNGFGWTNGVLRKLLVIDDGAATGTRCTRPAANDNLPSVHPRRGKSTNVAR
jgi:putative membrane protein